MTGFTSSRTSSETCVAVAVCYAPWWLNLEALDPGSDDRRQIVDEPGKSENSVPRVTRQAYESMSEKSQPLFPHWLDLE